MATDHGAFVSGLAIMPTAPSKSERLTLGGDKDEDVPLLRFEFGVSVSQQLLRAADDPCRSMHHIQERYQIDLVQQVLAEDFGVDMQIVRHRDPW